MDTRFLLRTDDHIVFMLDHDVQVEQMKLAALLAEDEIKVQQRVSVVQWKVADLPPRVASCDSLPPAQAFPCPPPESVPRWGEEVQVDFKDTSGTHGSVQKGWVYTFRDGDSWDRAAFEAFGIPMKVTDQRRDIKDVKNPQLACEPVYEQEESARQASFKRPPTGRSYNIDIKLQFRDQCMPIKITNATLPRTVETKARVVLGIGVELDEPRPIT
jgi:hypothetical protein